MRARTSVAAALSVAVIASALLMSACKPKDQPSESSSWKPAETTGSVAPAEAAPPVKLFEVGNIYAVRPGAQSPTFTLEKDATITEIMDYHYIIGGGPTPGTIALKAQDGTMYGPWATKGLEGQGGVENAYWDAKPMARVPAGTYTVVDSDPGTWSTNDEAEGLGMVTVFGELAK